MALFLSRANCRPLTSPYRIHRLISQSSPLSTVSPGNDNTSSTAAADSQRQGVSSEDIHHRNVQDGSGQIRFQSLREELESLRTINTNNAMGGSTVPWRINGSNISKSPFSDLRNSIQKLSESANEKKRGPIGSYNRGVQDGSAQIGFGTVKESLKSLRTTINADNAKGDSTSPWSSRGRNVDAYSAMLKGMEFYPNVDLRQCLLYLGVDYKSLMPSQSTPDYALHPPKDEFVERYFHTFKLMEKQGTELDSARVEAILRSKWACKELQVPENFILNFDDRHVIEFRDEETKTLYSMEIGETELWPEAVVDFLLDTMIEEMKNGVSFTSPSSRCPRWMGWENIKNALNDKFNKAYTKEHVCNKYCVLRTKYCDFKNLLLHTGMSYNASTGQVTADEKVWSLAARDSGKAVKQFREKGCPEYPKLCSLFEDTSATEASAKTSMRPYFLRSLL
ncbi:hypothetical protein LINPERHAP1_LOCUS32044 [Linum perenne]